MHPLGNHIDRRSYGYDGQGRLTSVKHSFDGGAEVTLWTGTYNAVGQLATPRHYYGPFEYLGNSLARVNEPGGYMDVSGKFHAYATDWQGNVRAVVSKHGSCAVVEQATWYYPYGMPTCDSRNAAINRYKYTAKELITDHATNLYDYPARLYDPVVPHWLTVDELTHSNAPTSHYSMCASDPINHIDPTGHDWIQTPDGDIYWRGDVDLFSGSEPKFGAIAIMKYSHVGFVIGKNIDGRIVILGGNQNNAINMSPNPMYKIKMFVYPTDYTPISLSLPSMNLKGRSLNFNSSR